MSENKIVVLKMKNQVEWKFKLDTPEKTIWAPHDCELSSFSHLEKDRKVKAALEKLKMRKNPQGRKGRLYSDRFRVKAGKNLYQVEFIEVLDLKKCLVRIHWPHFIKPPMVQIVPNHVRIQQKVARLERIIVERDDVIQECNEIIEKSNSQIKLLKSNGAKKTKDLLAAYRDVDNLEGKLKHEKDKNEKLNLDLIEMEGQKNTAIRERDEEIKKKEGAIRERDEAREQVDELRGQLREASSKLEEAEERFSNALQNSLKMETQLDLANAKAKELEGALSQMDKAALQEAQLKVIELGERLENEVSRTTQLREAKKVLQKEHDELKEEFEKSSKLKEQMLYSESLFQEDNNLRDPSYPFLNGPEDSLFDLNRL